MNRRRFWLAAGVIGLALVIALALLQQQRGAPTGPSAERSAEEPMIAPDGPAGRVAAVVDGDTIHLEGGERVRYLGIDTPELGNERTGGQAFGTAAAAKNRDLVGARVVRLERDAEERDRFGRLLRHVWLDDRLVAAELIRAGLGYAQLMPPNQKHRDLLERAERQARAAGVGVWSGWPTAAPAFETPVRPALLPLGNPRAPDCPPGVPPGQEARRLIGQAAQLCVREVRVERGTDAVYLRGRQPASGPLTLVLFRAVWAQLPSPLERYFDARTVVVRGRVELFEGAPEIVVRDAADLHLVP